MADNFKRNINVNYERFPPEYFSGANVHIFFGDIYIDEITTLQFTMQEQVMPVYGYNSYTYDETLRGSRIIQGMFRINFKHVDYIRQAVYKILGTEREDYINFPDWPDQQTVEKKKNELYDIAREGWSREFEQISEDFKEMMWADTDVEHLVGFDANRAYFDFERPFNIRIKYGPFDMPQSQYNAENLYRQKVSQGTIIEIQDIQIDQVTQNIDSSGEPVAEDYSFMAKDMSRGHSVENT